jgi:hypothetical protein
MAGSDVAATVIGRPQSAALSRASTLSSAIRAEPSERADADIILTPPARERPPRRTTVSRRRAERLWGPDPARVV